MTPGGIIPLWGARSSRNRGAASSRYEGRHHPGIGGRLPQESATETALTCHLVTPDGHPGDEILTHAADELEEHFGIGHVTLQPEKAPSAAHVAAMHNH
jgi:hypothetical protein